MLRLGSKQLCPCLISVTSGSGWSILCQPKLREFKASLHGTKCCFQTIDVLEGQGSRKVNTTSDRSIILNYIIKFIWAFGEFKS